LGFFGAISMIFRVSGGSGIAGAEREFAIDDVMRRQL
jgi:hypothetical protein